VLEYTKEQSLRLWKEMEKYLWQ